MMIHESCLNDVLSDIAILNIKGSDYCCIIRFISKNEAFKLIAKY